MLNKNVVYFSIMNNWISGKHQHFNKSSESSSFVFVTQLSKNKNMQIYI